MRIARSTFYDQPIRTADDTAIAAAMDGICDEFEHYGWPPVQAALRQQGVVVNHKKVRRLMREHDLQPRNATPLHDNDRQRSRPTNFSKSRQGHRPGRPRPALGRRHHLRPCCRRLRLCCCRSRCLVPARRGLCHQPFYRRAVDARCAFRRDRGEKAAAWLYPPFR